MARTSRKPNESDAEVSTSGETTARRVSAAMHGLSDAPSRKDSLGFEPYVDAVAKFLINKNTRPPLTLSIEGEWGSGKTSFMRQLRDRLDAHGTTVDFNAWRHDKDESLWAGFALAFVDQLSADMTFGQRLYAAGRLFVYRFDWWNGGWEFLRFVSVLLLWIAAVVALWFLVFSGAISVDSLLDEKSEWVGDVFRWTTRTGGIAGALWTGMWVVRRIKESIGNPLKQNLRSYLKSINYDERLSFIERFHKDFRLIVKTYARGQRVFVFIDDLDRCAIPKAADLLQSINLLIDDDNRIIFVIGLDREKVAAGFAVKFESLLPYLGNGVSADLADAPDRRTAGILFGYEFMEKFIQLPFRIPRPEPDELDKFLENLNSVAAPLDSPGRAGVSFASVFNSIKWMILRRFGVSPLTATFEITHDDEEHDPRWNTFELKAASDSPEVHQIAKMVAPALDNNPRRIIQFINSFRLQAYIAYFTGLFNPVEGSALEFEQLGKFVAIGLKWPRLILDLVDDSELLQRLTDPQADSKSPTDKERRWRDCEELLQILKAHPPGAQFARYSLAEVDIHRLLKVNARVAPKAPHIPKAKGREVEAEVGLNVELGAKVKASATFSVDVARPLNRESDGDEEEQRSSKRSKQHVIQAAEEAERAEMAESDQRAERLRQEEETQREAQELAITRERRTRTWTDDTRNSSVQAELVAYGKGTLHLRKDDGKILLVPLSKLSDADQEIVQNEIKTGTLPKKPLPEIVPE